jgi:hypothetical protein
MFKFR